jgi:hypothetical protein
LWGRVIEGCSALQLSALYIEANRRQQGQLSRCEGVIRLHLGLLFLRLAGQILFNGFEISVKYCVF